MHPRGDHLAETGVHVLAVVADENVDAHVQHLGGGVAEQLLERAVGFHHPLALGIHQVDAFGGLLDHVPVRAPRSA